MADHTKQQKSGKRSIHPRTHARSAISTAGHRASATYHLLSREEKNNQSQPSATATLQLEVFPQQIIQQQELRVDTASTLPCTRVGTLVLNFASPPCDSVSCGSWRRSIGADRRIGGGTTGWTGRPGANTVITPTTTCGASSFSRV